ncbi:MAG: hypothetical protein JSV66_18710 [Trueperaceae bacterium]|nr:MAG: hypothetical protein JSV66_18710 [Trueperaceae bacterium]
MMKAWKQPANRRLTRAAFGTLLLMFLATAGAQFLAEVQLVSAVTSELDPGLRLPTGSFRAVGRGEEALVAKVPGASAWHNWEIYTAQGVIATLQPAFVQQIATNFAVAGYFQSNLTENRIGTEEHKRYVFTDGASELLLYVIRTQRELIWFVAEAR